MGTQDAFDAAVEDMIDAHDSQQFQEEGYLDEVTRTIIDYDGGLPPNQED